MTTNIGKFSGQFPITFERINQNNQSILNKTDAISLTPKIYKSSPQTLDLPIFRERFNLSFTHNLGTTPDYVYMEGNITSNNSAYKYKINDKILIPFEEHWGYFNNTIIVFRYLYNAATFNLKDADGSNTTFERVFGNQNEITFIALAF